MSQDNTPPTGHPENIEGPTANPEAARSGLEKMKQDIAERTAKLDAQEAARPAQKFGPTPTMEHQPYADVGKANLLKAQMIQLLEPPTSGSFPFQVSKDDLLKVGLNILYVALSAAITYILQTVIPAIHTDNLYVLFLIPAITAGLQAAQKWLSDTRPADDQKRLPYKVYKQRLEGLKQQLKSATIDPHLDPKHGDK